MCVELTVIKNSSWNSFNPTPIYVMKEKFPSEKKNFTFLTELFSSLKDIPVQWAKIRQGLDIFKISSKCVFLSNGEV